MDKAIAYDSTQDITDPYGILDDDVMEGGRGSDGACNRFTNDGRSHRLNMDKFTWGWWRTDEKVP